MTTSADAATALNQQSAQKAVGLIAAFSTADFEGKVVRIPSWAEMVAVIVDEYAPILQRAKAGDNLHQMLEASLLLRKSGAPETAWLAIEQGLDEYKEAVARKY